MDRAQLEKILQKELAGKEDIAGRGEWTLDHCLRTARLAVTLRKLVDEPQQLDDLIFAAGLFHDVAHDSVAHELHEQAGARRTCELLTGVLPSDFLSEVAAVIAVHDDRRPDDGRSAAVHLVQDADMLDHFGTPRIWAAFSYAARHGISFTESLKHLDDFQRKRLWYGTLLHYDVSRRELFRRLDYEAQFTERAGTESRGEIGFAEEKGVCGNAENQCP